MLKACETRKETQGMEHSGLRAGINRDSWLIGGGGEEEGIWVYLG